jgi:hypothetical protein
MPEMNFRVKIIGGKRTPLEVYVTSMSVNKKEITLGNWKTISDEELAIAIDSAIIEYICR